MFMLLDIMSRLFMFIMLFGMFWLIMLLVIMLRLTIWEDMPLFMVFLYMLRPIWLSIIPILFMCIMLLGVIIWFLESSLREDESMYEVILVWMRSGSTERLNLPALSASSLMTWKPWLSAM